MWSCSGPKSTTHTCGGKPVLRQASQGQRPVSNASVIDEAPILLLVVLAAAFMLTVYIGKTVLERDLWVISSAVSLVVVGISSSGSSIALLWISACAWLMVEGLVAKQVRHNRRKRRASRDKMRHRGE